VIGPRIRTTRVAALTAAGALVLASCGGGSAGEEAESTSQAETPTPSVSMSPSPSSTVSVPPAVALTDVGADLSFGDAATVIHEPDQKTGTVLELTVRSATKGSIKDFSSFILDKDTQNSTPYYVDVTVANVGESRVGGTAVPLWGVDANNTLLPPAVFGMTFQRCQSDQLPKKFAPGDKLKTCLVFLAPDKGTMESVSYRPNQQFDPIVWTGEIAEPKAEPKKTKKKSKKNDNG
jgi:hypothetical protein